MFTLFLTSFIFGCQDDIHHWKFNYRFDEIKEIKIIEIVDEIVLDGLDFRVIKEIDLKYAKEICEDIESLTFRTYGPSLLSPYDKCFLIVFDNGEYDIIAQKESKHFKYVNGEIQAFNSWLFCEENEFDLLISKYLE